MTAWSGGLKYRPTMSRTFSTKNSWLLSVKVHRRCSLRWKAPHSRHRGLAHANARQWPHPVQMGAPVTTYPCGLQVAAYSTHFQNGWGVASDRAGLVSCYRQYLRLMDHWRSVIPADRLIDVDYEQTTAEPEATARRLIGLVGLPWDDACLRPERNTDTVRTASKWQARQPIYRTSVERWRKYEPWIGRSCCRQGESPSWPVSCWLLIQRIAQSLLLLPATSPECRVRAVGGLKGSRVVRLPGAS
jgi:Sulfotransferase family